MKIMKSIELKGLTKTSSLFTVADVVGAGISTESGDKPYLKLLAASASGVIGHFLEAKASNFLFDDIKVVVEEGKEVEALATILSHLETRKMTNDDIDFGLTDLTSLLGPLFNVPDDKLELSIKFNVSGQAISNDWMRPLSTALITGAISYFANKDEADVVQKSAVAAVGGGAISYGIGEYNQKEIYELLVTFEEVIEEPPAGG